MSIRKILIAILCMLAAIAAYAQGGRGITAVASDSLPPYIIVVEEGAAIAPLPDEDFYSRNAHVIFQVNKTGFNQNCDVARELEEVAIPMANRCNWTLAGIELRGAASPEGPLWLNRQLSRGRAQALIDFISQRLDAPLPEDVMTNTIPEDYPYLLWLLERDGDSAAPLLRRLIEQYGMKDPEGIEAIKAALRQAGGGKVWARLLRDYFPRVRAARVILYFAPAECPDERRWLDEAPIPEVPRFKIDNESAGLSIPMPDLGLHLIERKHMLSLSTNLLYYPFYMPQYGWAPMPNVGLEFYPRRGNFTFKAQFMFPYYHRWDKHKFFQIRDYHLEARYYINPGLLHTGWYVGAYANASKYGIGLSAKKGWQGEGVGGALKVGYVLPLGSGRWRLDFHAAAGGYYTRFDPYVYGNPVTGEVNGDYFYDWVNGSDSFKRRNHRLTWLGPTEIGVTISFDLLYWRCRQGGASMLRKEVMVW